MGVSVNRNLNAPRFETEAYRTTIQDNEPLSSSFLRVTAVDNDVQVTTCFIHRSSVYEKWQLRFNGHVLHSGFYVIFFFFFFQTLKKKIT